MSAHKLRVILSAQARTDLRSIARYGRANWGEARSAQYRAEITDMLTSLSLFPDLGRRTHLFPGEARVISVGTHVVYYRRVADEIRIVRILHKRTDPDDQLG